MWTLAKIENIRNHCEEQDEIDSCDTLMFCVYDYIYGKKIMYASELDEILVDHDHISILDHYLEMDGILFIEITNAREYVPEATLVHFLILFKSQKYPICLQSYCNRYDGKISEWPTWQEDLTRLLSSDYDTERIIVWNKLFGTDYDVDLSMNEWIEAYSSLPLDIYIYRPHGMGT